MRACIAHTPRCLTIPSSGPAFGRPLKSNVRPHRKLHMRAGLPFATLLALSREAQAAAGASSSAYRTKVVAKVGVGCPSFGGQRTVESARRQEEATQRPSERLLRSIEAQRFEPVSSHQLRRSGALSPRQAPRSAQASVRQPAHPALVCFAVQMQGKAAAPRARPNHSFKRTRLRRSA